MLDNSSGLESEGRSFRPSERHARDCALGTLVLDIHRFAFVVDSSGVTFMAFCAVVVYVAFYFLHLGLSHWRTGDLVSAAGELVIGFAGLISLFALVGVRRRRRAWIPELTDHYAQEALILRDTGLEYRTPLWLSYPLKSPQDLGRYESKHWSYSDLDRLSVYRAPSGRVTALDIIVAGEPMVLNHLEDRQELAEALKEVAQSHARIEEYPRLIPVWTRILVGCLGAATLALLVWMVSAL